MKKVMLFSSLFALATVGLIACSKEGSDKQPRLRNRTPVLGSPQQTQGGRGQNPGVLDPENSGHVSQKKNEPCHLENSKLDDLYCALILVSNTDDGVKPVLINTKPSELDEKRASYQFKNSEIKQQDDDSYLAKTEFRHTPRQIKLRVLQIVKNEEKVEVPAELAADQIVIPGDEDTDDILDALNIELKKVKNDEHLIVLSNIEALFQDKTQAQYEKNILSLVSQHRLTFAKSDEAEKAIEDELAFLNSYKVRLRYSILLNRDETATVNSIKVNGEELDEEQFKTQIQDNQRRLEIYITDLQVMKAENYSVEVEFEKE